MRQLGEVQCRAKRVGVCVLAVTVEPVPRVDDANRPGHQRIDFFSYIATTAPSFVSLWAEATQEGMMHDSVKPRESSLYD